jgi:undecaprenyl-diphosphatase
LWAGVIGYSRIYLGVHFPGDVIAGALVGMTLAGGMYAIMIRIGPLRAPEPSSQQP